MDGDLYLWLKALHVIAAISWMAGLLYLPRLFVYHCEAEPGSELSEKLKIMERRLQVAIMNPAMFFTVGFGVYMILVMGDVPPWLHVKLAAAAGLIASHLFMGRWRKDFANDRNSRPQRFYRIANEVPTVLMIIIVIMVIVRPF